MHRAHKKRLVRPTHNRNEKHQHLQQHHLLPHFSSTIAMLLVAPNAHSVTSLHPKILGFQDFERLKFSFFSGSF
jgi:hypothetical protein